MCQKSSIKIIWWGTSINEKKEYNLKVRQENVYNDLVRHRDRNCVLTKAWTHRRKNRWGYKMMESLRPTRIVSLDVKECWITIVRHRNTQDLKSEAQELKYHVSEAYENSLMAKKEKWVSKSTRWGTWDKKS